MDKAYSEQKREQRAPGVDVAVIADFEKKTRGVPYKLTIPLYGHSGMGAYLSNRRLTEFHEASSHRFYGTEEWSRVVNDDTP
ncbi:hypothetical protein [Paraburkholderia humisilvae]|uniref:hypothetical protein n=1 Tax=Paraburkholderia humisilvae TaxID=627669 RepID=UPI001582AE14|nr:hypothetical protein [Paraburkholderia humisilvae]